MKERDIVNNTNKRRSFKMELQAPYELKVTDKRGQFNESPTLPVSASPNAVVMMAMQKSD